MKKTFCKLLAVAAMAMSPQAMAAEPGRIIGGLALMGGGAALIGSARSDRKPGENAIDASPAKSAFGVIGVIGGGVMIASGLIGDSESSYSDIGALSGVSFGYTDNGNLGIQKKWQF